MDFKKNLNKIHHSLSNTFKNIEVGEGFNKNLGNYINIIIKEGIECNILISKKSLENNNFKWFYLSDPSDNDSIVEKSSTDITFYDDIMDIIINKKFDREYVKKIK
jgi:nitrogen regulatory protein PII-like uncharacterized protein